MCHDPRVRALLIWLAAILAPCLATRAASQPLPPATVEFPIPQTNHGIFLGGITTGPDGNLWFTEWSSCISSPSGCPRDAIGRITTSGVVTDFPLPAGSTARGITAGPDGNVWFVASGSVGFNPPTNPYIGRITPSGTVTQFACACANPFA